MSELVLPMGPMLILAGISAGWLAECLLHRRGHGLVVDMGLGGGTSFGGARSRPSSTLEPGCSPCSSAGSDAIAAQRIGWPPASGARERHATHRLAELRHTLPPAAGSSSGVAEGGERTGPPVLARALARLATTGIYLARGVPIEVQRAARSRAATEGTTLGHVLVSSLGEYGAGTWTPRADGGYPSR